MKLKGSSYDTLKEELEKKEGQGPFSKSTNIMLAFDLLKKGDIMSSNQINKVHLINIIKVMCSTLEWTENNEDLIETESETELTVNSSENKDKEQINDQNMTNKSQEICRFYKRGKCHHGKNGKKPDKHGKICAFSHPTTCKKFENYGHKEEGCRNKKCDKLHLNLCKIFMRHNFCKYEEKCRYFHPKKLKNINSKEPETQSNQQQNEEKILSRNLNPQNALLGNQHFMGCPVQGQDHFLGQMQNPQKLVIGQGNLSQEPFLGQRNNVQQIYLDLQNGQKQIMEMFMNLNQKFINLEKQNLQM